MITRMQDCGRTGSCVLALALCIGTVSGPWALAQPPAPPPPVPPPNTMGNLGYGPPGLFPGFQGFGLGYHLGYGYGGKGLGPGADGGYPFYGGPGYPHQWPSLNRGCGITPFAYFGGPGGPSPGCPNYFAPIGPLVNDPPVITVESDSPIDPGYASGYGGYTGTAPYPESFYAPFTVSAAAGGSASGISTDVPAGPATPAASPTIPPGPAIPAPSVPPTGPEPAPAALRQLGIDAVPVVDATGSRGLKLLRVDLNSRSARAGLEPGDVISSINGYLTAQPGNIPWIISHAAPDRVLRMKVRTVKDGQEHQVVVEVP